MRDRDVESRNDPAGTYCIVYLGLYSTTWSASPIRRELNGSDQCFEPVMFHLWKDDMMYIYIHRIRNGQYTLLASVFECL